MAEIKSNALVQQKRLEDVCDNLAMDYPKLYNVIDKMRWKPSDKTNTAAVDQYGRGIFSTEFIENLGLEELRFVAMHEAMHVLLFHHKRIEKIPNANQQIANIAADYVINVNLANNGFVILDGAVSESDAKALTGFPPEHIQRMAFEEIYELIIQQMQGQMQQQQQNQNSDNGDSGGSHGDSESGNTNNGSSSASGQEDDSKSGDNNSGSNQGKSADENGNENSIGSCLSNDITQEDLIAEEYKEETPPQSRNSRNAGHIDSRDHIAIDELLEDNNIDLRKLLDAFSYKISGRGTPKRSYRRPNKRYRDIYPITKGRIQEKPKDIVFAVDVSGSMNVEKTTRALSAIAKYAERYSVGLKYYFWSTRSSKIYNYSNRKQFIRHFESNYGGGTKLSACLRKGTSDGLKNFAGIVIISDFEFDEDYVSGIKGCGLEYFLVNVDNHPGDCFVEGFPEKNRCVVH